MKKYLLLFLILLKLNFSMSGQTYLMQRGSAIAEISGSGTSITTLGDDNFSEPISLGFNFSFFGNTYNDIYVGSNGYISFGEGHSDYTISILSGNTPNNFISFAGGDLNCSVGTPDINYFTTGSAPNRVFVLNFKNVILLGDNTNISSVQLQLYEGSNEIQMHIITLNANGYARTIGVENIDGSIGTTEAALNSNSTISITNEMIKFVEVLPLPSCPNNISVSSATSSTCTDLSTTLTASVSPSGNFEYQWYKGTLPIAGANSSTYNTTIADSYFVKITGSNCQLNSTSISVSTIPLKRIMGSHCVGSTLTACGYGTASIQWHKDGVPVSGQTASTFIPSQPGNYSITATTTGRVWTSYTTSLTLSSNFHFQDANVGWIVNQGGNIIYKTTDGGTNWVQQIDISTITTHQIIKILSLSSSVIIAIGSQGLILRSINGGANWNIVSNGIYNSLNDLSFIDSSTGWIAGNLGTLLKTTNGGATWSQINGISEDISAIRFKNATTGYAITISDLYETSFGSGNEHILIKTTDGGNNWVALETPLSFASWERFLYNHIPVLYISQSLNLGYISGDVSYITLYDIGGGIYEELQETSGGLSAFDTGFSNAGSYLSTYDYGFQDIEFISATEGWGVSYNQLSKTVNGGNSFTTEIIQGAGNLSSSFNIQILPSGNVGWGYGNGNKYLKMGMGNISELSPTFTIIDKPQTPILSTTANTNQLCSGQLVELKANGCAGIVEWSNGQIGNVTLHTYLTNTSFTATCSINGCISLVSSPINLIGSVAELILSGDATTGSKSAVESIQSSQKINADIITNYYGGRSISLNNGFEAKNGSVFKAEINSGFCVNNNNLILNIPFYNNVIDYSGYLKNGVLKGDLFPNRFTTGRKNNNLSALSFNGTNQYLDFGNWFSHQEFSISFWVNPSASQANAYTMLIDNNHTSSSSWFSQQDNTNTNAYSFGVNSTNQSGSVFFNLPPSVWTHLVFVKSYTDVKVYKDGILLGNTPYSGSIPYNSTQRLILGAWFNNGIPERFWNGKIDDLKVFNRVLTNYEAVFLFIE